MLWQWYISRRNKIKITKEVDFGTALTELYNKAKERNTTSPEHKLSRVYDNALITACKVAEGVIQIEIEGEIK